MEDDQRAKPIRIGFATLAIVLLVAICGWLWMDHGNSNGAPISNGAPCGPVAHEPLGWEESLPLPGKAIEPLQFSETELNDTPDERSLTFSLRIRMPKDVPSAYYPEEYGVLLNLRKPGGQPLTFAKKSTPQGSVDFSDLPFTDAFKLRCQVSMTGKWAGLCETFVLNIDKPGEYDCVVPVRGGPFVMGRLIDRMGLPVAGAELELDKRDERSSEILVYAAAIGRSDASGGFLLFPSGYEPTVGHGVRGRGILTAQLSIPEERRCIILGKWIEVGDDWVTELGDVVIGDGFDVEFRLYNNGVLYEGRADITLSHGLFGAKLEGTGSTYRMEGVPSLHDTGLFSWYHFYVSFRDLPNDNGIGFRQVTRIIKPEEMSGLRGPIEIHADRPE